jgi:hypothetical protein
MRSHETGGLYKMGFYGTRGFQLGLFGTEADRMRSLLILVANRMKFYGTSDIKALNYQYLALCVYPLMEVGG